MNTTERRMILRAAAGLVNQVRTKAGKIKLPVTPAVRTAQRKRAQADLVINRHRKAETTQRDRLNDRAMDLHEEIIHHLALGELDKMRVAYRKLMELAK
jgi:hypothetical protein